MTILYDCIFGPSLYRIFDANRSRDYVPFTVERYADLVINTIKIGKSTVTLLSPCIVFLFYRNYFSQSADLSGRTILESFIRSTSFKFITTVTMVYLLSSVIRGFLRCRNPSYKEFIQTFKSSNSIQSNLLKKDDDALKMVLEARHKLRHTYDYDFKHCPVDFKWSEGKFASERIPKLLTPQESGAGAQLNGTVVRMVSWLMAHTIGRIMLYPGSLDIFQIALSNALVTGRQFLIENYGASRYKLEARDGNKIDCIFVDQRKQQVTDSDFKGSTLVICAEGNAGFYEIGIFSSPLNLNYSVLGWNHPGFGGSTGSPYPQNEINAFDAVINFAVTKLDFNLEDIYIFAWSIGGFPAAWAASQYPELKGIILDASFDDVLPLARARMMPLLLPIVDVTIRNHFNLNVSAYLNLYKGPVRLIRRLQDEIIPLDPNDPIPSLSYSKNHNECLNELRSYIKTRGITEYPIDIDPDEIGLKRAESIILFMASQLMNHFNSTHCTPLPPNMFTEPFDLFALDN
ncbi:Protein abhd16a [Blomia tropicalis]|nr:Protein abhd16a [Blomia tropicalis]